MTDQPLSPCRTMTKSAGLASSCIIRANSFIFFGKGGEVATNRLEDQEVSVLALHLLQSCLVYINTLMLQRVLGEPSWRNRMADADRRGLCPVVYAHVSRPIDSDY